jgi:hypothetical protein
VENVWKRCARRSLSGVLRAGLSLRSFGQRDEVGATPIVGVIVIIPHVARSIAAAPERLQASMQNRHEPHLR